MIWQMLWKRNSLDRCLCKRVFSFSINVLRASVILFIHNEHSLVDGATNIIAFFESLSLKVLDVLSETSNPFILPLPLPLVSKSDSNDNSLRNIGCKMKSRLILIILITFIIFFFIDDSLIYLPIHFKFLVFVTLKRKLLSTWQRFGRLCK